MLCTFIGSFIFRLSEVWHWFNIFYGKAFVCNSHVQHKYSCRHKWLCHSSWSRMIHLLRLQCPCNRLNSSGCFLWFHWPLSFCSKTLLNHFLLFSLAWTWKLHQWIYWNSPTGPRWCLYFVRLCYAGTRTGSSRLSTNTKKEWNTESQNLFSKFEWKKPEITMWKIEVSTHKDLTVFI